MKSTQSNVFNTPPSRLAEILDLESSTSGLWGEADMGVIFRHQLDTPLRIDFAQAGKQLALKLNDSTVDQTSFDRTFREVIFDTQTNIELLGLVKSFAKMKRHDTLNPLPNDVALALYFASIAAMTRCGETMTKLSHEDQQNGIQWVLDRSWIDEATRQLLLEAMTVLDTSSGT